MPRSPCLTCPMYGLPRHLRDDAAHECAGGCVRDDQVAAPVRPLERVRMTEADREVLRELGRSERARRVA